MYTRAMGELANEGACVSAAKVYDTARGDTAEKGVIATTRKTNQTHQDTRHAGTHAQIIRRARTPPEGGGAPKESYLAQRTWPSGILPAGYQTS